jgi:tetratricopeptide (TPR) repeat protein
MIKQTLIVTGAVFLAGCQSSNTQSPGSQSSQGTSTKAKTQPLFKGLGDHKRPVTTESSQAQKYFDQGLTWAFSFNHDEAIRSFTQATVLDPGCAMAWWGVALCNGPHINNAGMDEARSRAAWLALKQAEAALDTESEAERALIGALAARYADPEAGTLPLTPPDRAPLDKAYADAMAIVRGRFPDDNDITVLYAESLMDLRPWDLWDRDGTPRPETPDIIAALEAVLAADANHPGANHYYIHAVEASSLASRAVPAADRLRTLVPASGHMVHMPAHIDVRVGRWDQAAESNRRAIKADTAYRKISPNQGFYRLYMAHNHHFLSWACMMQGRRAESLSAARAMIAGVPPDFIENQGAIIDGYMPIAIESLMRFGRWDEILAEPAPPKALPITTAFWRYARACAFAATGRVDDAVVEQRAFRRAVSAVPEDAHMAINNARKVLSIADHVLAGEIAFRRGDLDGAVDDLNDAIEIEDSLLYMEPPDWVQPVRHTLGAMLVSAGRTSEAAEVYQKDLEYWPENGWSLLGLAQCLEAEKDPAAAEVRERFKKAWSDADTKIQTTCLCVPGK